ncbi:hypothetical protein BG004_004835 [Podila humilis]|nr:hypothetical protein BG004_004835 [Podila humilis]
MLPASFGSNSTSHGKAPLNVVFVIDTHTPSDLSSVQVKHAVLRLKKALLRILLYFQGHMDERFQWSYQFFDSFISQDLTVATHRPLQVLSTGTLTACIDEYKRQIRPCAEKKGSSSLKNGGYLGRASPSANLRTELVHSLADYGLGMASYQSPVKPTLSRSQTLQKHFPPVAIRNYMYILSPLPRTWDDAVYFLEGRRQQGETSISAGPRTHEILDVLQKVKGCFFDQGLWDRFLDNQLSLSWIDTTGDPPVGGSEPAQTRISTTALIRSTLELTMKAFGGHIIPFHILYGTLGPEDMYSFSTVFGSYRSMHINPGLGVKMSKANWQPLPSIQSGVTSTESYPLMSVWAGDIMLAESSACDGKEDICERASRLFSTLQQTREVLLLTVAFLRNQGTDECSLNTEGSTQRDENNGATYTRQAILYPAAPGGSGLVQVLLSKIDLNQHVHTATHPQDEAQRFQMTMMERPWGKLGGFVQVSNTKTRSERSHKLAQTPESILDWFRCPQQQASARPPLPPPPPMSIASQPNPFLDSRSSASKYTPGRSIDEASHFTKNISRAESIDDLCLGVRKAYIEHLYQDDSTVVDYLKKLNAASKEITALAAKQSVALQEAQQKLVAFMIEFLRIWPSKMTSKYKLIGKELNIGRLSEPKSRDNYAILDDERPELDQWKKQVSQSIKDSDLRLQLKKLKNKDIQMQIIQNLLILLLVNKYGLEENRPFKKDPGAAKAVSSFMDDLCISASIDERPAGMMSPQTPRSKGMDPAKKFFTKVISRYYGPSLPKIVEKLSIKCGVEKSLLLSPRPVRIVSRPGMTRSISMGVLSKPKPLDLFSVVAKGANGGSGTSKSSTPTDVTPKHGFPMSRQSTSENARSVLNSSIFRNRQVSMTIGSVNGLDAISSSSNTSKSHNGGGNSSNVNVLGGNELSLFNVANQNRARAQVSSSKSRPQLHRSQTTSDLNGADPIDAKEEELEVPQFARIKLKRFYHDRESEEVLKSFRRKNPLSKSDGIHSSVAAIVDDIKDKCNDGDIGEVSQYLPHGGTTSWGAIPSFNAYHPSTDSIPQPTSPTLRHAKPRTSATMDNSPEIPLTIIPSTPTKVGDGYSLSIDGVSLLRTPGSHSQGRRYGQWNVPSTPTRRDRIYQGQLFASQIRGGSNRTVFGTLGSPGRDKRRRVFNDDDDDEVEDKNETEALYLGSGLFQSGRRIDNNSGSSAGLQSPEASKKMRTT